MPRARIGLDLVQIGAKNGGCLSAEVGYVLYEIAQQFNLPNASIHLISI